MRYAHITKHDGKYIASFFFLLTSWWDITGMIVNVKVNYPIVGRSSGWCFLKRKNDSPGVLMISGFDFLFVFRDFCSMGFCLGLYKHRGLQFLIWHWWVRRKNCSPKELQLPHVALGSFWTSLQQPCFFGFYGFHVNPLGSCWPSQLFFLLDLLGQEGILWWTPR